MGKTIETGNKKLATMGLVAELALIILLVSYGEFSVYRLVLLLLLASQSLWVRGLKWSNVGLSRPTSVQNAFWLSVVVAAIILVAVRIVIVPSAVWLTGIPIDLSALGDPGDAQALWIWMGQAWTLAAFGEEMVFRGYLICRIIDFVGDTPIGRTIALVASSVLFGLAHHYQGWAGVITTGTIGSILALLYFASQRNLWTVILCHALVDTLALLAIYFDRRLWLFP